MLDAPQTITEPVMQAAHPHLVQFDTEYLSHVRTSPG